MSWDTAIDIYDPPVAMMESAANSPALVRLVRDITAACKILIPASFACMPSENDTAKYPRAMGRPSLIPDIKAVFLGFFSDMLSIITTFFMSVKTVCRLA